MHDRPRSARRLAPLLAAALLLPACGGSGGGDAGRIAHPGGDELVLRLAFEGGFAMPEMLFAQPPTFVLRGDGLVVQQGAQIDIFPGPALPPLQARRLSEAGVQQVLAAVAATRLFAESREYRGAMAMVADAPDSVFTLHAEDRAVTVRIYGLGTIDAANPPPGMDPGERQAHQLLSELSDRLMTLDTWLPASAWAEAQWHPLVPDAFRLLVRSADGEAPDPNVPAQQELPWPIAGDPATFGDSAAAAFGEEARCGVVEGDDAKAWYDALSAANQLTRWSAGGHRYAVAVRPLLAGDDRSCAAEPVG